MDLLTTQVHSIYFQHRNDIDWCIDILLDKHINVAGGDGGTYSTAPAP